MSLWLASSASAGASLMVDMKNRDARIALGGAARALRAPQRCLWCVAMEKCRWNSSLGAAAMLDRDGYRPNVGIIIVNLRNQVFWGKRVRQHAWQFPQGGINHGESPETAMYRE